MQAFYGALAGQRANKGVFITTFAFTLAALDFARSGERVVLVDGPRLANLMMNTRSTSRGGLSRCRSSTPTISRSSN